MGENVALGELSQCYFWVPYDFGCYKTKDPWKARAQTLKWTPLELLEMRALTYTVFSKTRRQCWEHWYLGSSDTQISNWIQILPLDGSCSIFCFCSFQDYCRVHSPPVTRWKRLWVFYGCVRGWSLPSHAAATPGPLMNNKMVLEHRHRRKGLGIQAGITPSELIGNFYVWK